MDTTLPEIVPISARRYASVLVEQIKTVLPRNREPEQFAMNAQSVERVGMMKPIRVNDKFLERTGFYELVIGQGRLEIHQKLGLTAIMAEIVTCSRNEAYIQSLVENLARFKPGTMHYAHELKRMYDEGCSFADLARISTRSENYMRQYIRLVEQGEDRLIQGVEQGIFPISFAMQVAGADNGQIQNVLMDAFDEGLVTMNYFAEARRIITSRAQLGKEKKAPAEPYTVDKLKEDIATATKVKVSYVREAKGKETRFLTLYNSINLLWRDAEFVQLLEHENLHKRPELAGDFTYESTVTPQEQVP